MKMVMRLLVILSLVTLHAMPAFDFPCQPTVDVPNGTRKIPENAFYNCLELSAVTLPPSLVEIGSRAFWATDLTTVAIGSAVTTIGHSAFAFNHKLHSVKLGDSGMSLRAIEDFAFHATNLTTVAIGSPVTTIGNQAFSKCWHLRSVELGNSVRTIGEMAFYGTSVESIVIGESVTSVGEKAFWRCPLTTLIIGDSVTSIGKRAFENDRNSDQLTSVVLGNSLTEIRFGSFGTLAFQCGRVKSKDGTKFYFQVDAGEATCTRCPGPGFSGLHVAVVCGLILIVMLCLARLAFSKCEDYGDLKVIRMSAVSSYVMTTAHILHLIVSDVPWPPRLAAFLRVFDFLYFDIRIARPECSFAIDRVRLQFQLILGLYALPALLCLIYGVTIAYESMKVRSVAVFQIRKSVSSILTMLHWMFVWVLGSAWLPFGCTWWHEWETPRRTARLLKDPTVGCSSKDRNWERLVSSGFLGFVMFQLILPVYMVVSARRSQMAFATSPYKEGWKRIWLSVELLYRSLTVVVKVFTAVESVTDGNGRRDAVLQVRAAMLVIIMLTYQALLLVCRPYLHEVITYKDAASFFTVLICEMTKICFAAAVLLTVQGQSARPDAHHAVLEVFLIVTISFWLLLVLHLLYVYGWKQSLHRCCRRRSSAATRASPAHPGVHTPGERCDLGTFAPHAKHAVISAPGATARSWEVHVSRPDGTRVYGLLLNSFDGIVLQEPPMLKVGETWAVCLADSLEVEVVDFGDLSFAGEAEYEFWSNAIQRSKFLDNYSFACVWVPGIKGHCREASSFETWYQSQPNSSSVKRWPSISKTVWNKYQSTLPWICDSLSKGYADSPSSPACRNCGWFDFWAINVMRCHAANQKLRFAYLPLALYDGQPQFYCTAPGHEGHYYVGIAQKVELEWVQNVMRMVVQPISFVQDVLGATESQLRMIAEVVMAEDKICDEADRKEIYRRLDAILVERRMARRRRKTHRRLLMIVLVMSLTFSVCCLEAGISNRGNHRIRYGREGFRAFNVLIGSVLFAYVLVLVCNLQRIFLKFDQIFDLQDRKDDDHFHFLLGGHLRKITSSFGTEEVRAYSLARSMSGSMSQSASLGRFMSQSTSLRRFAKAMTGTSEADAAADSDLSQSTSFKSFLRVLSGDTQRRSGHDDNAGAGDRFSAGVYQRIRAISTNMLPFASPQCDITCSNSQPTVIGHYRHPDGPTVMSI